MNELKLIELLGAVESLESDFDKMYREIIGLRAENEKLRGALESLRLCHPKTHKNKTYLPCAVCTALSVLESK